MSLPQLSDSERWILAFRHGQTDWNAEGRIQGHLDIPLNELGRSQAKKLILPAQRLGAQMILTSDLSRASESAEIVSAHLKIPILADERLREIHLGKAQGKTRGEIETEFGTEISDRLGKQPLSDMDVTLLGSESGDEVWRRATTAITETLLLHPEIKRLAVASHGGVLRRLIQFAQREDGKGTTPFEQIGWIGNCALYPLVFDLEKRQWRLRLWLPR